MFSCGVTQFPVIYGRFSMSVGVVYTYFITKMVVNVLGIVGEKLEGATDKDSYSPTNYDHASPN